MISHVLLNLSRKVLSYLICIPCAVKKECTAVYKLLNHVVFMNV